MRILKFLAAAVAAASVIGSLQAQSSDSDVQAKAREALERAVAEQNAQAAATNKPMPPKKVVKPAPAPVVVKKTPAPVVTTSQPQPQPQTDAEAMRQQHLRELEAARARQAAAQPVAVQTAPPPASGGLSPEAEAKVREALRQAEANVDAQRPSAAPVIVTRTTTRPMPSKTTYVPSATPAGGVPVTTTALTPKQQKLAALLAKYKMDQIGPKEYFQEKAKILAEPGD